MAKQVVIAAVLMSVACSSSDVVTVGSKNFTESIILGEIIAQRLESEGLQVERKFNLGGTFINHEAIVAGQLDIYVEYTGTAFSAVLQMPMENDPAAVRDTVERIYAERWNLEWLDPLGFNNTYAILVRGEDARNLGLNKVSDVASHTSDWTAGFGHEFLNRSDGYDGLISHYDLEFEAPPRSMDLGLIYRALANGEIDLTAGNSTDGQIEALDLVHLDDDLNYFPPYEAVPVVRRDLLERFPIVEETLSELANSLTESQMARMNYQVDVERIRPATVAAEFLASLEGAAAAN